MFIRHIWLRAVARTCSSLSVAPGRIRPFDTLNISTVHDALQPGVYLTDSKVAVLNDQAPGNDAKKVRSNSPAKRKGVKAGAEDAIEISVTTACQARRVSSRLAVSIDDMFQLALHLAERLDELESGGAKILVVQGDDLCLAWPRSHRRSGTESLHLIAVSGNVTAVFPLHLRRENQP